MKKKIIIFIDGGSRGNPGNSAIGVVFKDNNGRVIKEYSEFIGKKTNNQAEYEALIFALKKAKLIFGKNKIKEISFEIRSDSTLLVKQMKGEYKIKNKEIQELFLEAWNLKIDFPEISFLLVPREENKEADRMVNIALDKMESEQKLF